MEPKANYWGEKVNLVVFFKGDNATHLSGETEASSVYTEKLLHTILNPNSHYIFSLLN